MGKTVRRSGARALVDRSQLHWRLDVTFGEDDARTRKDNAPLNWNVMHKTPLLFLHNAAIGKKTSIKREMCMTALDVDAP